MNYEKAKDREAAVKSTKLVACKPKTGISSKLIGPALPGGMISAKEAISRYIITRNDLYFWRRAGVLGKYDKGYSEREIQSAIASRDSIGYVDSTLSHRRGHVRLISPIKNRHFIG